MNPVSGPAVRDAYTRRRAGTRDAVASGGSRTRAPGRLSACIRHLGKLITGLGQGPGEQIASWPLAPNASSVPLARRRTRARLTTWGLDGLVEHAELLVSELVTNALRHARGPYRLTLYAADGLLRCEVEDADTALPYRYHARDDDECGRGVAVLDLLACCWGSEATPQGKVVWFELPTQSLSGSHC